MPLRMPRQEDDGCVTGPKTLKYLQGCFNIVGPRVVPASDKINKLKAVSNC
ncbi:conserved hypothetical protein [Ricinus communis]|uniref:Uncharacterized protein n=1 Tax=Ricinus communis TaxID=3988 RepID=B9S4K5_RICCO|nr:conserved hypothetical protein [Ricinus communis]